jgi:hypothetical protein
MFDLSSVPAAEQDAVRREIHALYLQCGGEDIDRAISRDRKVVAEHERELDHVATLPFDKPYRWRIAPSVGLRAQKDMERQQKRRAELLALCFEDVLKKRGHAQPKAALEVAPIDGAHGGQVDQLSAFIGEAVEALNEWKQERTEASPPVETDAIVTAA